MAVLSRTSDQHVTPVKCCDVPLGCTRSSRFAWESSCREIPAVLFPEMPPLRVGRWTTAIRSWARRWSAWYWCCSVMPPESAAGAASRRRRAAPRRARSPWRRVRQAADRLRPSSRPAAPGTPACREATGTARGVGTARVRRRPRARGAVLAAYRVFRRQRQRPPHRRLDLQALSSSACRPLRHPHRSLLEWCPRQRRAACSAA